MNYAINYYFEPRYKVDFYQILIKILSSNYLTNYGF